jgi:hypothetical protein
MTWDELAGAVTAGHPGVTVRKMFGMPCLRRPDGKVVASLWKDGGITVKLVDETVRAEALALPGAEPGHHAFDPNRQMRSGFTSRPHSPLSGNASSSVLSAKSGEARTGTSADPDAENGSSGGPL